MTGTKGCKFCDKKGLLVLPLRYSVVVAGQPADLGAVPALPGKLGAGVNDLALSEHAKYAVRLAREGYLYVLLERLGIKSWYAYYITEDAFLYEFPADSPPQIKPEFSCEATSCGINASMVAIPNAQDVKKAYFLYAPSPLTPAKLKEYKDHADAYVSQKKMQLLNPADWVTGSTNQPHTLLSTEAGRTVLEYALFNQYEKALDSPLGKVMGGQLFPAMSAAYAGTPADAKGQYSGRLGALLNAMKRHGAAAIALYDHIGITQELNNFRNSAFAKLDYFMSQKDSNQISNDYKFAVQQAIEGVKKGIEKNFIVANQEYLDRSRNWSEQRSEQRLNQAKFLRAQGNIEGAVAIEKDVAEIRAVRDKNYQKLLDESKAKAKTLWPTKYEPLLNSGELQAFTRQVNTHIDSCKDLAKKREDDHLIWLKDKRLIDAFDTFDPQHQYAGFGFSSHAQLCYFGMDGMSKSENFLDKWITATAIERTNLFLRAYIYNQNAIKIEAEKAIADARAVAAAAPDIRHIDWGHAVKGAKSLIDFFKKADSAWDEWARVGPDGKQGNAWQVNGFGEKSEGRLLSKCSSITRSVFRLGIGNGGDKLIVGQLCALLYPRVGGLAENLRMDELMYRIDPEFPFPYEEKASPEKGKVVTKARGPKPANLPPTSPTGVPRNIDPEATRARAIAARENVQKTLQDALDNPHTSNYHQIRIGTVIAGLEAINLAMQFPHLFKSSEITWDDRLKVIGASLALAGAAYDLSYTGAKVMREQAEWLAAKGEVSAASKGAMRGAGEATRGGLKLASGSLSSGAGLIGAYFDVKSAFEAREKNDSFLMCLYFTRAGTGGFGAVFGLAAAYSYSGLFLTRAAIKYSSNVALRKAALTLGLKAAQMAARVRLLTIVARFNLAGLVLTGAEIIYRSFFMDNEMESWCKKSVFRKDKGNKPFETQDKELENLETAFQQRAY